MRLQARSLKRGHHPTHAELSVVSGSAGEKAAWMGTNNHWWVTMLTATGMNRKGHPPVLGTTARLIFLKNKPGQVTALHKVLPWFSASQDGVWRGAGQTDSSPPCRPSPAHRCFYHAQLFPQLLACASHGEHTAFWHLGLGSYLGSSSP